MHARGTHARSQMGEREGERKKQRQNGREKKEKKEKEKEIHFKRTTGSFTAIVGIVGYCWYPGEIHISKAKAARKIN